MTRTGKYGDAEADGAERHTGHSDGRTCDRCEVLTLVEKYVAEYGSFSIVGDGDGITVGAGGRYSDGSVTL